MTRPTPSRAPLALALALLACGGAGSSATSSAAGDAGTSGDAAPPASPTSPATTGSSAPGFDAKSAIHGVGPSGTTIVLSDAPDLCASLAKQDACGAPLGTSFLRLTTSGKPPGSFSGGAATALLVTPGRVVVSAGDGRVELGAESPDGMLSGSYDLGAAGISGALSTRRCAALDALAGSGSLHSSQACSGSLRSVDGRSEFDERCACGERATSRQCTLGAGDAAWSCLCTSASGAHSACQSPAPAPGVVTAPPSCCPAG